MTHKKQDETCGSQTLVDGVCVKCGYEPQFKREWFSKAVWKQLVAKGVKDKDE